MSNSARVTRNSTCYTLLDPDNKDLACDYCKRILDPLINNRGKPKAEKCERPWDIQYYNHHNISYALR